MPVLFVDGWDYGDAIHLGGVVSPFSPPCKYTDYSSVTSCSIQPGRVSSAAAGGGNSFRFDSSAFAQQTKTKLFGAARPAYCLGFAYRKVGSGTGAPGIHIVRYEAGGATLVNPGNFNDGTNATTSLMLELMPDNSLSVWTGPGGTPNFPGSLLWNSLGTYLVPNDTWIYIELSIDTTAGSWALYIDDVLLQTQTGVSLPAGIDRYSFTSFTFESHQIDDHYCTDGERLGPCRVTGFAPNFQSTHQWAPLNDTNLSQVQEFGNRAGKNTPDDNTSYVWANAAGTKDLYGFAAPACYGRILAIALNADGSAIAGSPSVNFVVKVASTEYAAGFSDAYIGGYTIRQGLSLLNPSTATYWSDAEITGALFGFTFAGSGELRITQWMLEKLVSLRAVPYNCGQGSYSFTG